MEEQTTLIGDSQKYLRIMLDEDSERENEIIQRHIDDDSLDDDIKIAAIAYSILLKSRMVNVSTEEANAAISEAQSILSKGL